MFLNVIKLLSFIGLFTVHINLLSFIVLSTLQLLAHR